MSDKKSYDILGSAPVMSYGAPPWELDFRPGVEPWMVEQLAKIKEIQGRGRSALKPPRPPVEKPKPLRLKKPYLVRKRVLFVCGCETSCSAYFSARCRARSGYERGLKTYRKRALIGTAWFVNVQGVARQLTEFVPADGPMECKTCGCDVKEAKR